MPPKGFKRSAESRAKQSATIKAKRNGHAPAPHKAVLDGRDAVVYLRHALGKWPVAKKCNGVAKLYVQLALATLEGKA
jgi:hypothetical protein